MITSTATALRSYAGAPSELQRLRDRIDELEQLLGLKECIEFVFFKGIHRRRMQMVARLLLARELVSRAAIVLAIGEADAGMSDKQCDVYVCYCRTQLKPHGIIVHTDRCRGWYVTAADKPKLRALLAGSPQ